MDRKKKTLEEVMDEYDQWLINWLIVYGENAIRTDDLFDGLNDMGKSNLYGMAISKTHVRFVSVLNSYNTWVKLSRTGLDYIKLISRNE